MIFSNKNLFQFDIFIYVKRFIHLLIKASSFDFLMKEKSIISLLKSIINHGIYMHNTFPTLLKFFFFFKNKKQKLPLGRRKSYCGHCLKSNLIIP